MPWPMRYISEHLPVILKSQCAKIDKFKTCWHTLRLGDCLWRWRKVVVQGEDEEDDHSRLASQRRVCEGKMTSIVIIPAILWKDPWWSLMIPNLWLSNQHCQQCEWWPRRWVIRFRVFCWQMINEALHWDVIDPHVRQQMVKLWSQSWSS